MVLVTIVVVLTVEVVVVVVVGAAVSGVKKEACRGLPSREWCPAGGGAWAPGLVMSPAML